MRTPLLHRLAFVGLMGVIALSAIDADYSGTWRFVSQRGHLTPRFSQSDIQIKALTNRTLELSAPAPLGKLVFVADRTKHAAQSGASATWRGSADTTPVFDDRSDLSSPSRNSATTVLDPQPGRWPPSVERWTLEINDRTLRLQCFKSSRDSVPAIDLTYEKR